MSRELDARHALTRRCLALPAAMLATVGALSACDPASTTTTDRGFDGPRTTEPQLQARPQQPAEDSLLSQAQADVNFFLNQRQAMTESGAASSSPSDTMLSTGSPGQNVAKSDGPAPDIQWIDPVGAGAVRPSQQVARSTETRPNDNASSGEVSEPAVVNQPLASDTPKQRPPATAASNAKTQETDAGDPLNVDPTGKLIVDLSGELYRSAHRSDTPLRELMLIAATSLVSPDRSINARGIASLSERDREILATMQEFFAALGSDLESADDTDEAVRSAVAQLQQALDRRPPFGITTATLCTRVRGFGNYEEFEKHSFLAQSQQKVIVYIELENFASELNGENEWVTELAQELVIYSGRDGIPVWSESWQSVVDVTRNKRQDFFTVQLVTLPSALSVGRYHLKVRVRDETTGAMAERTIPFEMVADPRMAAQVR